MTDSKEQLDGLAEVRNRISYGDSALFSAEYLAAFLRGLPESDAAKALDEVLRYQHKFLRRQAAEEVLERLPPMILPYRWEANIHNLMEILFPEGLGDVAPRNFFAWQRQLAVRARSQVRPTQSEARERWLAKCRRDPKWQESSARIAEAARVYSIRRTSPRVQARWQDDTLRERLIRAGDGELKCTHTSITRSCADCQQLDRVAADAHYGWRQPPTVPHQSPYRDSLAEKLRACRCCSRGHDWSGISPPKCLYCAEAALSAEVEVSARRWGGWYWLRQALLDDAWPENDIAVLAERFRVPGKLGYSPFSGSVEFPGTRLLIATMVIPLPWFQTDTKRDLRERVDTLIDEIWKVGGLHASRSTGRSKVRSKDLDRRLNWLWEHKVLGRPLTELSETESRVEVDDMMDLKSLRRAVNKAIRELQD